MANSYTLHAFSLPIGCNLIQCLFFCHCFSQLNLFVITLTNHRNLPFVLPRRFWRILLVVTWTNRKPLFVLLRGFGVSYWLSPGPIESRLLCYLEVLHLLLLLCGLELPEEVQPVGGLCLVAVYGQGHREGQHHGYQHILGRNVVVRTVPEHKKKYLATLIYCLIVLCLNANYRYLQTACSMGNEPRLFQIQRLLKR